MLNNLFLASSGLAQWITNSFPTIQGIVVVIMSVASIVMIIAILVSPPDSGTGNNAITGVNESYYSKNKGGSNLGRIRNLIIICASVIAFCSILYFVLLGIFKNG